MFPDNTYSLPLTNSLGSVHTSNHTYLTPSDIMPVTSTRSGLDINAHFQEFIDVQIPRIFKGLTSDQVSAACRAMYPERYI